jgi:hypothetical protein
VTIVDDWREYPAIEFDASPGGLRVLCWSGSSAHEDCRKLSSWTTDRSFVVGHWVRGGVRLRLHSGWQVLAIRTLAQVRREFME